MDGYRDRSHEFLGTTTMTWPPPCRIRILQIPTQDGLVPAHQVVRSGPCQCHETESLKAFA